MIRLLLLLALVASVPAVLAKDDPKPLTCVVPGPRPTKHMLFLVDTSGSMRGDSFAKALGAVAMITQQPIDAGKFGVIGWSDYPLRWKHNGRDWWELPSERATKRATRWLCGSSQSSGGTSLAPALTLGLQDKQRKLTLIVVSDGIGLDRKACLAAVKAGQAARVKAGLGKAMVMCYGIGSTPAFVGSQSVLADVARAGGGGFYVSK